MRMRALVACVLAGAVVGVVACGGDAPTSSGTTTSPPPTTSPAGTYAISTINTKALPVAVIADSGFTWEVTAGSMALTSDGKYLAVETFRQTVPGDVSVFVDTTTGTWALSGNVVTFTNTLDIPPSTFTATWASTGTLTLSELDGKNTNTFVYAIQK